MSMVNLYLLLFFYVEWHLLMKVLEVLLERVKKMKKLTVLLAFCWILLISQILAISSLYYDGLQDIPGPPSVITLVDRQNNELNIESKLEENIEATLKNLSRQITASTEVLDDQEEQHKTADDQHEPLHSMSEEEISAPSASQHISVQEDKIQDSGGVDTPMEEVPSTIQPDTHNVTAPAQKGAESNETEENQMPVFSEWAQKQMAEEEKKLGENVNASAMKRSTKPSGNKLPSLKLRAKNYAAPDCGAKIIASNPEAQSTGSVLTSHKDEYLLNPCTSKIWFVVELCEAIQAERVELANFELFSSSPKDFSVLVSNRFPTRDWSNVGRFTAKDERDVQGFNLHPHLFGKFVRVEIQSHYNSEHYCPVSLFRVYGTSEFEAFEETDSTPSLGEDPDDDELVVPGAELGIAGTHENESHENGVGSKDRKDKNQNNILKSAGEAVMNMVKKAAEALGKTNENVSSFENNTAESNNTGVGVVQTRELPSNANFRPCLSLLYQPLCLSCTPELKIRMEHVMNCEQNLLIGLLNTRLLSGMFDESQHLLCANILGFSIGGKTQEKSWNINRSMLSWFPKEFLASFCNLRAYEEGYIKLAKSAVAKTGVKPREQPTPDTKVPSMPSVETVHHNNREQPTLVVVPSIKAPTKDEEPQLVSSNDSEVIKKAPVQGDVNIFNVKEEKPQEPPVTEPNVEQSNQSLTQPVVDNTQDDTNNILNGGSSLEEMDGILLEQTIDSTNSGGIPTITTTTTPSPGSQSSQKVQPESVVLRLSNRIKALERNMSLSGQYLEELSRRYRKQVEELQTSYAKTLHEIEDQNRRMRENELSLRDENERLRADFLSFRDSILSWKNISIAVCSYLALQTVLVWIIVRGCKPANESVRRIDGEQKQLAIDLEDKPVKCQFLRRRSIDGVVGAGQNQLSPKKKRPSEEALNITGTYENLLIDEGGDYVRAERKKVRNKHRKISAPCMVQPNGDGKVKRASSLEPATVSTKADLIRTESAPEPRKLSPEKGMPEEDNRIEELPLLEDHDEFIIPSASDLSYNEFVPDSTSEIVKTNGMLSSSSSIDSKSTSKSSKVRRLSSPAFFKPSLLRSSISRKSSKSGKKSAISQNVSSASSNTSSNVSSSNLRISINLHSAGSVGSSTQKDEQEDPIPTGRDPVTTNTSNGREWYKLKKTSSQDKFTKRNSKSESPDVESIRNGSINGLPSDDVASRKSRLKSSVSFNGSTSSTEKKLSGSGGSFRRLFRKVF